MPPSPHPRKPKTPSARRRSTKTPVTPTPPQPLAEPSAPPARLFPIVAIGVGDYRHNDFGKIFYPIFDIVGWAPQTVFDETLPAATAEPEKPAPAKPMRQAPKANAPRF